MKRGNCFPLLAKQGERAEAGRGPRPTSLPVCSQDWSAAAWSPEHQKELASPSLQKPSMHVARPLISPVTDASPESPWSTDKKACVLREMTNEGHRENESRKEDKDQESARPESCLEFQRRLNHEGRRGTCDCPRAVYGSSFPP